MYATTRQERASDVARAKQLRGRLKDEGQHNARVIVVTERMRMQLKEAGLPHKRGELFPAMGDLLGQLAVHDAAKIITESMTHLSFLSSSHRRRGGFDPNKLA